MQMQKIICHAGKCIEREPIDNLIDNECDDNLCSDIEKELYGEV